MFLSICVEMRKLNLIEMSVQDISTPFPLTPIYTHIFTIQFIHGAAELNTLSSPLILLLTKVLKQVSNFALTHLYTD